jgi:hypothetical protein
MLDSSMCFADLSVGDWFETNLYSENGSKRYDKLCSGWKVNRDRAVNAVEIETGDEVWFEPEDRVTLLCRS